MDEKQRLQDPLWKKWGAYVSERSWGSVREDYSGDGNAWDYFPHDLARSKPYLWGEDGIAGLCDIDQTFVFSLAFWNGKDPILKERMFGLNTYEGNHGEDVKEYYFYLDATPTHSYLKYLYKYPQGAYPYNQLVETNKQRSTADREFELLDTGIFNDQKYFDIFITYAKAAPEDICIRIDIFNRGPEKATLHVLPQLISQSKVLLVADPPPTEILFTQKKDGFHRYVIHNEPLPKEGKKSCFYYKNLSIESQKCFTIRLRLGSSSLKDVDAVIDQRKKEADAFYQSFSTIQRAALSGLLWNKQFYKYNVKTWIEAPPPVRLNGRNCHWTHLNAHHIISMPDKWEYPWFASWDLALQTLPLSLVDLAEAKKQLHLLLTIEYFHPNGQIPAYEWSFSDLNPPVQAFALWKLYQKDHDRDYLELCFLKLIRNFNWWINKVDSLGNNFFEGGFLGLDNISVIDRSKPLSDGGLIEQSDGTGWMAFFALNMMRIALELAKKDPAFEETASNYLEHFLLVSRAMELPSKRSISMWNEEDGFFYDLMRYPDGTCQQLKVRSLVGIIPFFSIDFYETTDFSQFPRFQKNFQLFSKKYPRDFTKCITHLPNRYLFSLMDTTRIKRVLAKILDPNEFLSPYGIRSLSKFHEKHPFIFDNNKVSYEPGESFERIKGGNSNWRGPIWFPINYLFLSSLHRLFEATGDPSLQKAHHDLSHRLLALFEKDSSGLRPVHAESSPFFNDLLLFYEHYHGDTGRGLGASHQTGWSSLIANIIDESGLKPFP